MNTDLGNRSDIKGPGPIKMIFMGLVSFRRFRQNSYFLDSLCWDWSHKNLYFYETGPNIL